MVARVAVAPESGLEPAAGFAPRQPNLYSHGLERPTAADGTVTASIGDILAAVGVLSNANSLSKNS